jgi:hypothetical protein
MSVSNYTEYCSSPDSLPSYRSLPLPTDLNIFMIPRDNRTNTSEIAMRACCAPKPVNILGDCILWCEIPEEYINDNAANSEESPAAAAINQCLQREGRTTGISGWNLSSASCPAPVSIAVAAWAGAVIAILFVWLPGQLE